MVLEHFMVKKELTEAEIAESIPDLWQPLTQQQRELLAQNFTIQKYKKNETIYCEGQQPRVIAGYPMQTVIQFSRFNAGTATKKPPQNRPVMPSLFRKVLPVGYVAT